MYNGPVQLSPIAEKLSHHSFKEVWDQRCGTFVEELEGAHLLGTFERHAWRLHPYKLKWAFVCSGERFVRLENPCFGGLVSITDSASLYASVTVWTAFVAFYPADPALVSHCICPCRLIDPYLQVWHPDLTLWWNRFCRWESLDGRSSSILMFGSRSSTFVLLHRVVVQMSEGAGLDSIGQRRTGWRQ